MFKKEIQDVKMFSKSFMYVFVRFLLVLILKIFLHVRQCVHKLRKGLNMRKSLAGIYKIPFHKNVLAVIIFSMSFFCLGETLAAFKYVCTQNFSTKIYSPENSL